MSTEAEKAAGPRKRMTAAARREVIAVAAAEVFAERGYQGASIDEIASRSGVTPPVVYDHFESKQDLYRCLLERHFADLRQVWSSNFSGEDPPERRIARSFEAWFAYVEAHPFAGRVLFRDTSGDPEIAAVHAAVAARSREAILALFAAEPGVERTAGSVDGEGLDMAWVVLRGVLQGLAVWWSENPQVPRERVVATAMNALWIGFERVLGGQAWQPLLGDRG
ncbi:MAG TPA: TetR/AcrR family transcriptional regulator [Solirubrobacterales bacterium]|nr:TetR/AcrR family transcriptional regulator [Solirubrobacterales bacterium]